MTFPSRIRNGKGFTFIEMVMVILLMGILTTVSISTFDKAMDESQFDETVVEMQSIRDALIGDSEIREGGSRTSFGYAGDVGSLPTDGQGLNSLFTKPAAVANWTINTTARFGLGWNGPYLTGSGVSSSFLTDAWGRAYLYSSSTSPATITSLGADGAVGGTQFNQDITVTIPDNLLKGTVHGFISQGGSPYTGTADVDLYYSLNGGIATMTDAVTAADQGHFSFNNVPFGRRSVIIYVPSRPTLGLGPIVFNMDNPQYVISNDSTNLAGGGSGSSTTTTTLPPSCSAGRISYVANSASVSTANRRLTFSVNIASNVTLSSMKATLATLARTYSQVVLDGITRACSGSLFTPCPASSGQTITFSPTVSLTSGNGKQFRIDYDTSINSETSVTVEFAYATGCDRLIIPL